MPKEETLTSKTAREYRIKYGPKKPNLSLARILYNENKPLFNSIDHARTALRLIEGKAGQRSAQNIKDKSLVQDTPRPYNPYKLPDSDETSYEPYILKGAKRILILSDIHLPYHSIQALSAAFDYAKKQQPDLILLNGDTLDFHGLSRFVKDPRKRNFAAELTSFKEFMVVLDKAFPKAKKIFKVGNHEERYLNFLYQKAGELHGVEEFELESIIKARANGIDIIGDKRIIKAGGLNIIHGHEFATGFFSPVNIARGLYLRGKTSAIQGHNHASSEHTEPNMNNEITTTWSVGCLCELHPAYMPLNKWNNGFAIVDVDGNSFEVSNKRIYKGKVL
jgi:predicted phosphodiesterase